MVHHLRSWRWHGATALGAVLVSAWVLDLHGGAGGVLVGLTIGLLLLAHGGGHAQDSAPAKRLPQGSSTGQAPS